MFALCLVGRYGVIGLGRWLTVRLKRRQRKLRASMSRRLADGGIGLRWALARDERTGRVVVRDRSFGDPPPQASG